MRVTRAADNTAYLRGPVAGALGQMMPGAPAFVWIPALLIAAALALPPCLPRIPGYGDGIRDLGRVAQVADPGDPGTFCFARRVGHRNERRAVSAYSLADRKDRPPVEEILVCCHGPAPGHSQLPGRLRPHCGAIAARHGATVIRKRAWHRTAPGRPRILGRRFHPYHPQLSLCLASREGGDAQPRPARRGVRPGAGAWAMVGVFPYYADAAPPRHCRRGSSCCLIHPQRFRSSVIAAIRDLHLGDIPSVQRRL